MTVLLLPVFEDDHALGWPNHESAPEIDYLDPAEAFTRSWPSDAHFAAYSVPSVKRRLRLGAIGLLTHGWPMVLLVIDVDHPWKNEKPATPEAAAAKRERIERWWADELNKLAALEKNHPGAFVHRSRKRGYRVIFRLASPFVIQTVDDKEAWRERYRRELLYLARRFGIVGDPACADITRLYRLPLVLSDGVLTSPEPTGNPAAIGDWNHEPSAAELEADTGMARTLATLHSKGWRPVLQALAPERGGQEGQRTAPELRPEDQDEARLHKRAAAYLASMAPSIEGAEGNAALWAAALAMVRGFALGPTTALAMLLRDFNPRCSPPWSRSEIERTCRNAADHAERPYGYLRDAEGGEKGLRHKPSERRQPRQEKHSHDTKEAPMSAEHEHDQADEGQGPPPQLDPWRYNPSDIGNGERFAAQHGQSLRHCPKWGKWLVWDGRRWAEDERNDVRRRAKITALSIYQEGRSLRGGDEREQARRKTLAAWAAKSEGRDRCEAMIAMAQSEPGIPVVPSELDRDPWLLNVENGTLDLRTGELRPHRREDLITKLAPVAYDPTAEAPHFRAFLDSITAGDQELQSFLQRFFGYALTGETAEHVLVMAYGTGSNGKSTLLKAFLALLGDYAYQAPADLIMAKKGETHPTDQAGLFGRRLAVCMETPEGRSMDEARMKALTGGDLITARRMREDFWTFTPTHKLILATNHKPVIRTTDHGTWRRQKLVPFTVQIPNDKQDKSLPEKLNAEASGLLRWAVEGCLAWRRQGLGEPEAVKAATAGWREESDPLAAFLAAECELGDGFKIPVADLFAAYERFANNNDDDVMSKQAFGRRLTERGLVHRKGSKGVRLWLGVRMAPVHHGVEGGGVAIGGAYFRHSSLGKGSYDEEPRTKRHPAPPATRGHMSLVTPSQDPPAPAGLAAGAESEGTDVLL